MAMGTVLAGPERRRRWTPTEKLRIVEESCRGEASVADVARRHDVHRNLLHLWRRQARAGALSSATGRRLPFAPVTVAAGEPAALRPCGASGPAIEVMLRNGRVLRLPDGGVPAWVAGLADALEGTTQ